MVNPNEHHQVDPREARPAEAPRVGVSDKISTPVTTGWESTERVGATWDFMEISNMSTAFLDLICFDGIYHQPNLIWLENADEPLDLHGI